MLSLLRGNSTRINANYMQRGSKSKAEKREKMEGGGGGLKIIIKKMNEICFRVFDIELRQFQKQISDD